MMSLHKSFSLIVCAQFHEWSGNMKPFTCPEASTCLRECDIVNTPKHCEWAEKETSRTGTKELVVFLFGFTVLRPGYFHSYGSKCDHANVPV